jgi:2,3-dihydroxybenzoate decarboxylase
MGALVNGCTNIGDNQTPRYSDQPENDVVWATVAEFDVPVTFRARPMH